MSRAAIRKALETRLNAMVPALETAWENSPYTPKVGTAYQRVTLLPAIPDNPTMDKNLAREQGLMQITLFYPLDKGPGPAESRAQLIRAQFPGGLSITVDGVTTTISGTVFQQTGLREEGWWSLPVRIPYHANIFS